MYLSQAEVQRSGLLTDVAIEDGLNAADAGALIRRRRKERGLTQEQLVDRTGLSSQSYLSALEKGRYHIGRSEHFAAVARELQLSEDDIRAISPGSVITLHLPAAAHSAASRGYRVPDAPPTPIPDELLEAAALFGSSPELAGLREHRWQAWMASVPHRKRPATPGEWLDFYMRVKDTIDPPEIAH
ncbi:helix-turn-helix domain-containing protein [Deinococcus aquaticus]|uniref:helix-turn-helix domain-containing protein n=1 Tax=Deinococcus aquaticus TaxID=328692 RepID=UPI003F4820C0